MYFMGEKKLSLTSFSNKGRKQMNFSSKQEFSFTSNYHLAMFF